MVLVLGLAAFVTIIVIREHRKVKELPPTSVEIESQNWNCEIELAEESGTRIPALLECEVKYWTDDDLSRRTCRISLEFGDSHLGATDRDFFEAFCRVREQLAKLGLIPLCYGASRNVFPSAVLRDMSDGLQAYRLQMAARINTDDFVDIFDYGADVDPVSVEIQKQFHDDWRQSLGTTRRKKVSEPGITWP